MVFSPSFFRTLVNTLSQFYPLSTNAHTLCRTRACVCVCVQGTIKLTNRNQETEYTVLVMYYRQVMPALTVCIFSCDCCCRWSFGSRSCCCSCVQNMPDLSPASPSSPFFLFLARSFPLLLLSIHYHLSLSEPLQV